MDNMESSKARSVTLKYNAEYIAQDSYNYDHALSLKTTIQLTTPVQNFWYPLIVADKYTEKTQIRKEEWLFHAHISTVKPVTLANIESLKYTMRKEKNFFHDFQKFLIHWYRNGS